MINAQTFSLRDVIRFVGKQEEELYKFFVQLNFADLEFKLRYHNYNQPVDLSKSLLAEGMEKYEHILAGHVLSYDQLAAVEHLSISASDCYKVTEINTTRDAADVLCHLLEIFRAEALSQAQESTRYEQLAKVVRITEVATIMCEYVNALHCYNNVHYSTR
jgi:hypothetical protein